MNHKYIILCSLCLLILSCKQEVHLTKIEGKRLEINDSLKGIESIEDFIKPFREHVNKNLDSVIAYSVGTYSKTDGELNTAIGNFMADAVKELCNPVFNSRTGNNIDLVLLNHGGIRSIISEGDISPRTAYGIMPFENEVVVTNLKGTHVKELVNYLISAKRAHPISGLNLKVNTDFELLDAKVNGDLIDDDKTYFVATNDYLYNGGDRMNFFSHGDSLHVLNYKIRDVLIDYFYKVDTLDLKADNRFIKIN